MGTSLRAFKAVVLSQRFSFFYLQVVRHIHEWMAEKLQACFSKDTGCPNHNMWMINCSYIIRHMFSSVVDYFNALFSFYFWNWPVLKYL